MYITTQAELESLSHQLQSSEMLAIDTEFVREKTYFHRLGLIQVAGNGICAAVDPISIKNIDPFLDLIKNPKVLKVFHAGKQDLEILNRLCDCGTIKPVFDTQVAASMVGWGAQISFAKIVHRVTGKRIHKSETYTDWCRRPLSQGQINYAINDVRYLVPVYEKLRKKLTKMQRLDWLEGELENLVDEEKFKLPDPYRQFLRIKNIRGLKPGNLAVLRELAAWREREAIQRDCLPKAIVRDEPLLEIARIAPENPQQLGSIRGFHKKEINRSGEGIIDAIRKGLAVPEGQAPELPESEGYSTRPGVESFLAAFVQIRSEELKIEPNVLADRKMIHEFVKYYEQKKNPDSLPLFRGWRKELIGVPLYSLLDGKSGLAINPSGNVLLIPSNPP